MYWSLINLCSGCICLYSSVKFPEVYKIKWYPFYLIVSGINNNATQKDSLENGTRKLKFLAMQCPTRLILATGSIDYNYTAWFITRSAHIKIT